AVAGGLHDDVAVEAEVVAQREELRGRRVARGVLALRGIGELRPGPEHVAVRVDGALGQPEGGRARPVVPVQPAGRLLESAGYGPRACRGVSVRHQSSTYSRPAAARGSRMP